MGNIVDINIDINNPAIGREDIIKLITMLAINNITAYINFYWDNIPLKMIVKLSEIHIVDAVGKNIPLLDLYIENINMDRTIALSNLIKCSNNIASININNVNNNIDRNVNNIELQGAILLNALKSNNNMMINTSIKITT